MRVIFNIKYLASFGQNVYVYGTAPGLGNWEIDQALKLVCKDESNWMGFLDVPYGTSFEYKYIVSDGSNVIPEPGCNRSFTAEEKFGDTFVLVDDWHAAPTSMDKIWSSIAVSDIMFRREEKREFLLPDIKHHISHNQRLVIFQVRALFVPKSYDVYLCGSIPALGSWEPKVATRMDDGDDPIWRCAVWIPSNTEFFSYKFVVAAQGCVAPMWEGRMNREVTVPRVPKTSSAPMRIDADVFTWSHDAPSFRAAGVSIPVFSLRSNNSMGVGDFVDLVDMATFAGRCGLHVLQLLPINDTMVSGTWWDSYPYSNLSSFALHPLYARPSAMGELPQDLKNKMDEVGAMLNENPKVDYEEVLKTKIDFLRQVWKYQFETVTDLQSTVQKYLDENELWLPSYCAFKELAQRYKTTDFTEWPEKYQVCTDEIVSDAFKKWSVDSEAWFWAWLQYQLGTQLSNVSKRCAELGVALKGDIPIGVNRISVDTWSFPDQFRMDTSTGAPPDAFAVDGQNWGFPTYNWDEMRKDKFRWWCARLQTMGKYFHAFRIDHVLGWFRIWEIPADCILGNGLRGHFCPSQGILGDWIRHDPSGIHDILRLTRPWLPERVVNQLCGRHSDYIKTTFMCPDETRPGPDNHLTFKPEFVTEKLIEKFLHKRALEAEQESEEQGQRMEKENEEIMSAIVRLGNNVIMMEDIHVRDVFYPRWHLWETISFNELPDGWKHILVHWHNEYFFKWHDGIWRNSAHMKFPTLLGATRMLCCGEDLGMLAPCVTPTMEQYSVLGLRVQRMPADPTITFYDPATYPYLNVATTSTHDMPPIRAWWSPEHPSQEELSNLQFFWNHLLHRPGVRPQDLPCDAALDIICSHLNSPCMLAVLPLQDFLACFDDYMYHGNPHDEVINIPAIARHYWRYRMHLNVDEMAEDETLIKSIRILVARSGRLMME